MDSADAKAKGAKRAAITIVPVILGLLATGAASKAAGVGFFTDAQATRGAAVYAASCAQCHAANLQGQAGPALVGATFKASYASGTAGQLYDFIKAQMPADAPGSLSEQKYLDVSAYLLQKNGYPAGSSELTTASAPGLKLAGVATSTSATAATDEIIRSAPPTNKVFSALPSGAKVATSNAQMVGAASDDADWLLHGRTYDNQRYSPLTQITTSNVRSLSPVAVVQTGMVASFETTPVVVSGVMYVTTPVVSNQMKIMALNAATGENLWQTTYNLGNYQICCGPVNRGVAVGYGKVYAVTLDNKLIALDARNGKLLWQTTVADSKVGYSQTMAPQIYDGKVIIGSAGGEWAIRGYVAAYDAQSGKQVWRWWGTDPKTYGGDSWQRGGSMVWTTPAIDAQRHLVVFSTGNPNPDLSGVGRKGDNLYSDSIVGLDANTGKLRWYYQEVKHDVWDYDAVSNVVLFDVHVDGKTIPAAGEAGKVGWFFIVDRRNGKLIRKSAPYVMMSKNMFTTPTKDGVNMLPGANGGAEWSPPAYSPKTRDVYVLAMNQLMKFVTEGDPVTSPGAIRLGSTFTNVAVPKGGIQNGPFVAINTETGKIDWTYTAPQPLIGGALATAGNLVFMGEGNGWFDAFDARNGRKLWRYQLGAGVNAPPISYAVNGVQYIAVAAGGNFQLGYPYGDAIAIFKLNTK
jgi:alcohol dehydrogenase (cytochrome c)